MASKLSGSPAHSANAQHNATNSSEAEEDEVSSLPKIVPNKNAVLQHASRQSGDAPYTPAPPRNSQPGFLGVLRRLSSSNTPIISGKGNHGLVERRVLNVDKNRERVRISDLQQSKLRRVAFCVDVEIAPMPKYAEEESTTKKPVEKKEKRKIVEKGEGEALKNPNALREQKEEEGVVKATGESLPKEPEKEGTALRNGQPKEPEDAEDGEPKTDKETTRKKEKKKKSEAERKAKKEQKRREALEKGAIPMEIHLEDDSSTEDAPARQPKVQTTPTTNPARIYRRCCQLRETDILTKITFQLPKSTESCPNGIVEKLDLTGYFLSLQDLMTLGDFLAVVPVKEVVLENCGLTDEGVRVILAGLLAAKRPQVKHRKPSTNSTDQVPQGGVIERLVLKNNKIGTEAWKHICLFIHLCRSIKCIDLSSLPFPAPSAQVKTPITHHLHPHHSPQAPVDLSSLLCRSIGERLAGSELELINIGSTGIAANQLGAFIDGVLKSGVSRLGLAHNNLDEQGVQHVARYLQSAKCEGLDLGGNNLRDHVDVIAGAINEHDALWALSLAECNLRPSSLCKLFPKLMQLHNFKFLDLSHNHDLFESEPSAIGLLRR
jgi:hypothetical protein